MRFTRLEIKNFRQYQSLTFQFPKTTGYDLHVIVADNGVGKTNILNAITWCLYEVEPHLGDESRSLPRINLKVKSEALQRGEHFATVSVTVYAEDEDETIVFSRKMKVQLQAPPEKDFEHRSELTVTVNSTGDAKIICKEEADSYIERYMPKKIRQYFFFDGEQLDSYFISDESSKIKETIHAISQVDVVSRIKDRLGKLIQNKQSEAGKRAPNIQALNTELLGIQTEIHNISDQISQLEKQIAISEAVIKTNTEHLSGQENLPELEAKYQKLTQQKDRLEHQQSICLKDLFTFVREMKVALSFYNCAKGTLNLIAEKEAQNALPPNIDKQLLRKLLDDGNGHCFLCDQPLSAHSRSYIEELLEKIQVSSETSNLLMSIRSELSRIVESAESYCEQKEEILGRYRSVCDSLETCEQDLQDIDNEIKRFEDKQQVIDWHNERKKHINLLDYNKGKKAVAESQLKQAENRQQDTERSLKKALEKEQACKRLRQLIDFASRAKSVVTEIETEMMSEVRSQMETRTMEYFSRLIWKQGVYDHIILDDKYQLDLIHRDGYPCVGSCSAAERSLLALSFTLALHEVSGFQSLLFIDTPVSRVTGQNRANFAAVLQQVSQSKQLIMAFTPDEYSENIKKVFGPIASSNIHLLMNEDNEITTAE